MFIFSFCDINDTIILEIKNILFNFKYDGK